MGPVPSYVHQHRARRLVQYESEWRRPLGVSVAHGLGSSFRRPTSPGGHLVLGPGRAAGAVLSATALLALFSEPALGARGTGAGRRGPRRGVGGLGFCRPTVPARICAEGREPRGPSRGALSSVGPIGCPEIGGTFSVRLGEQGWGLQRLRTALSLTRTGWKDLKARHFAILNDGRHVNHPQNLHDGAVFFVRGLDDPAVPSQR